MLHLCFLVFLWIKERNGKALHKLSIYSRKFQLSFLLLIIIDYVEKQWLLCFRFVAYERIIIFSQIIIYLKNHSTTCNYNIFYNKIILFSFVIMLLSVFFFSNKLVFRESLINLHSYSLIIKLFAQTNSV